MLLIFGPWLIMWIITGILIFNPELGIKLIWGFVRLVFLAVVVYVGYHAVTEAQPYMWLWEK